MSWLLMMHARLLFTILLFFGAMTLWGLFNYLRGQSVSDHYFGALVSRELLMLAQSLIGVALWIGGFMAPRHSIHVLYGLIAVLTLPGTYTYMRGRDGRTEQLVYALVCLFLCGAALRSLETGRLPGT